LLAALALVTTAAGGNAENANLCQNGGWQTLTRSDGSTFANQGDCVSYGAQGGTLVARSQSQLDCESFGGTFVVGTTPVLWTCVGLVSTSVEAWNQKFIQLSDDCGADALAADSVLWSLSAVGFPQIPGAGTVVCEVAS
jgi:hypothetical protein